MSEYTQDKHTHTLRPLGNDAPTSKAETEALQTATAYIAEKKAQSAVVLTNSKPALQALTSDAPNQSVLKLQKDLQRLPHNKVMLQWIPTHPGIQGNGEADEPAKSGSKNRSHGVHQPTKRQNPAPQQAKNCMEGVYHGLQSISRPDQPP